MRFKFAVVSLLFAGIAHGDITVDGNFVSATQVDQDTRRLTVKNGGTFDTNDFDQHFGSILSNDAQGNMLSFANSVVTTGSDGADTLFDGILTDVPGGGNGRFVKVGTGTLTLTNSANDWSGGTEIDGGAIAVASDGAFGNAVSTITLNTGTIVTTTTFSLNREYALVGSGTFNVRSGTLTVAGIAGSGNLIKSGGGTLLMEVVGNSYSGETHISSGTIVINDASSLGNGGNVVFEGSGGKLVLNDANVPVNHDVILNADAVFDTQRHLLNLTGTVSGAGHLTVIDSLQSGGTLLLLAGSTHPGGLLIDGAKVSAGVDNAFGTGRVTLQSETQAAELDLGAGGQNHSIASLVGDARSMVHSFLGGTLTVGSDNTDTLFAGVMDGVGALVKTGTGTLTLSGANTYSGGTTVSNGTLAGTVDSIQGFITNNAAIVIDQTSGSGNFGANLQGAGTLTKTGGGTMIITGNNDFYTGDTHVDGGTVLLNAGTHLGGGTTFLNNTTLGVNDADVAINSGVMLSAGGGILDTQGHTFTLNGAITGSGGLTILDSKHNHGTMVLGGFNDYTGPTTIDEATVSSLFTPQALGTGRVTLINSGVLDLNDFDQTIGSLATDGTGKVYLGLGFLTVGADGTDSTFSGQILEGGISGNVGGGLVKVGTGTLVLSGANSFSGGMTVNEGTVRMGAAGAAGGGPLTTDVSGTIDLNNFNQSVGAVTNNGTTHLRNATLAVTGDYSGAGTLTSSLESDNVYGRMTVSSTATLTGGTLRLLLVGPYIPENNKTFTIVSAGTVSGTFDTIIEPAALNFEPIYSSTDVVMRASAVSFTDIVKNTDDAALAEILEDLRPTATGDLATVIGNLNTLSRDQLLQAFDLINPKTLSSLAHIVTTNSGITAAGLYPRLSAIHVAQRDHSTPAFALYDSRTGNNSIPVLMQLAYNGQNLQSFDYRASADADAGFFATGTGSFGRQDTFQSGVGQQIGYDFNTAGITFGGDYRLNDHAVVGGLTGYRSINSQLDLDAGRTHVDSSLLGLYGSLTDHGLYMDLYLGGAFNFYQTHRHVAFGSIDRTANGRPSGQQFDSQVELGYDRVTPHITFTPLVSAAYTRVHINAFTETDADSLNMHVGDITSESLRSDIGLRLSHSYSFSSGAHHVLPRLSAAWEHEHKNQGNSVDAELASGAGHAFSAPTSEPGRNSAILTAGFTLQWTDALSFLADYTGDLGRTNFYAHTFNGSLRYRF